MSYSVAIGEVKCHKNKVRMPNSSMVKCIISLGNITMRFAQNNASKRKIKTKLWGCQGTSLCACY